MMSRPITLTQLNRATLDRQLLLRRRKVSVRDALFRLAGIQAEDPVSPFIGLHARMEAFSSASFDRALESREVVRGLLMRSTMHAVIREDYASWAETLRDVSIRSVHRDFRKPSKRLISIGCCARQAN